MPRRNRRNRVSPRPLPKDGSTFLGSQTVEGPKWTHGEPFVMRHIGSAAATKFYICPGCNQNIPPRVAHIVGMIVAFSVAPTVVGEETAEMSAAVAEAVRVVRASGLPNETNAMFTLIEGEWDEVFAVIKEATDAVRKVSPRTSLVVKADIREGVTGQLTQKVESVNRRLEENK